MGMVDVENCAFAHIIAAALLSPGPKQVCMSMDSATSMTLHDCITFLFVGEGARGGKDILRVRFQPEHYLSLSRAYRGSTTPHQPTLLVIGADGALGYLAVDNFVQTVLRLPIAAT